MLQLFRNFFKSRFGVVVALAFLALIAVAFAGGDLANTGTFGGVAGGDRVAMVGKEKISTSDLSRTANTALDQLRQGQPTLTMPVFVREGGLERVLDELIDRYAIAGFGRKHGLRAGHRLIDSEIAQIPAFRGPDGKFDQQIYQQLIQQQGLTDKAVRQDLALTLLAQQVAIPVAFGTDVPAELVQRYSALLKETRKGAIAVLPGALYAPQGDPDEKELAAYYATNRDNYIRPERRVIRYASFTDSAIGTVAAPTEAEIAARYKRDAARFAATSARSFTQLVVPSEAQAKQIVATVQAGTTLDAAASASGLAVSRIGPSSKAELAEQTSAAVAEAGFAARSGALAAPARSNLGWHILRVDAVRDTPARSLDAARAEIVPQLAAEKRRAALSDMTARIESQFDEGGSLADTAKEFGITVQTTPPLTADGRVYGTADQQAPAVLQRALNTAFAMDEGEPQLAEVEPGKTFLIFEVADITVSAAAPLAEIKADVLADYKLSKGSEAAKQAAGRVLARIGKGMSMADAVKAEGKPIPAPDAINMSRDQLGALGRRPPTPLVLLFSMAAGTEKRLEAPNKAGWFVVQLDEIEPGKVAPNDPQMQLARRELAMVAGREYEQQFRAAVRDEMGVERNDKAIAAVKTQLTGGGN